MFASTRHALAPVTCIGGLVCAALISLPQVTLAQTWYEEYDQAEAALEAEDWTGALDHLSRALEQRPSSGERVRTYGMRFIDYLPYLKLAQAYLGLGQHDAALEALETEEGQVAVQSVRGGPKLLAEMRRRATTELAALEQQRSERVDQLVRASLDQAKALRGQNRADEALAALDRALAVAPEHPDASALRSELLESLAREHQQEQAARRVDDEITAGRRAFGSRDFETAALRFERALQLAPESAEASAGLDDARSALRRQLGEQQQETPSARALDATLRALEARLGAEDLDGARLQLQRALALAPDDARVLELGRDVGRLRARLAPSEATARSWDGELDEAERLLASGNPGRALRVTNQVLIDQPQHERALSVAARGYAQLSRALLDDDVNGPLIVLDDSRFGRLDDDQKLLGLMGSSGAWSTNASFS